MNNTLYPRLAAVNIGKNKKLYVPYILSSVITIAMYYIMGSVHSNEGLNEMRGGYFLGTATAMGIIVIGVFSCIFLLYTNSFLMKQRKKEFGLYNVLGMEKKHIAGIMFFESVYTFLICTAGGLAFGILFDKLTYLLLCKLLQYEIKLGFHISMISILHTFIVFGVIMFLTLISNIVRVYKTNPIELLHGGNIGEKEPKTKAFSAILGAAFLAAGYTIAIVTENPINAIPLFLVAVLCVIFGTYLLFMSGSIAVLKILKKNKNYYYNKNHFNSVSGMIYRMKQNAAGLSNICILSTMVLVMVSTTFSLYLGTEDSLEKRYPQDLGIYYECRRSGNQDEPEFDSEIAENIEKVVKETAEKENIKLINYHQSEHLAFKADFDGKTVNRDHFFGEDSYSFYFVTLENYTDLTGDNTVLRDNEVLVLTSGKKQIDDSFELYGRTYDVVRHLDADKSLTILQYITDTGGYILNNDNYIIVSDTDALKQIILDDYSENPYSGSYASLIDFDLEGTPEEKIAVGEIFYSAISAYNKTDPVGIFSVVSKDENRADIYGLNGSFLFLGITLGLLFLIVTVMIIYYKQVSEGYSDRERFIIMQKVGMSRAEVKSTIHSQVLTVFFLPLITACVHLAFSFPIVSRLLLLFGLTNTAIFIISLVVTAAAFAVIYLIVYSLTARTYYKIVSK